LGVGGGGLAFLKHFHLKKFFEWLMNWDAPSIFSDVFGYKNRILFVGSVMLLKWTLDEY